MTFQECDRLFRNDDIRQLGETEDGLRYLKLRSLSRREHILQLFEAAQLEPSSTRARDLFPEAFAAGIDGSTLDSVIRTIYGIERKERRSSESELVSELYQLQVFDWGGLHHNSLEKTIVNNYVKKIFNYDVLCQAIEQELHNSMRGYVLCSWYNHWTSIIIEDVFRDHEAVLPAVGKVKKIDFFINDVPFDLKVTYLPEGFVSDTRRAGNLRPEVTLLKREARRVELHFDSGMSAAKLLEDLWRKLRDHPATEAQDLVSEFTAFRMSLLEECQKDPSRLIRWLYENQGERRFDASNRLFLVLVDTNSFFDSWKLKRAKPLLDAKIRSYLDAAGDNPGQEVSFDWEGDTYSAIADVVFVVHP